MDMHDFYLFEIDYNNSTTRPIGAKVIKMSNFNRCDSDLIHMCVQEDEITSIRAYDFQSKNLSKSLI